MIAGTDCGFATFAALMPVHPTVTWAKLARWPRALASGELWGGTPAHHRVALHA